MVNMICTYSTEKENYVYSSDSYDVIDVEFKFVVSLVD